MGVCFLLEYSVLRAREYSQGIEHSDRSNSRSPKHRSGQIEPPRVRSDILLGIAVFPVPCHSAPQLASTIGYAQCGAASGQPGGTAQVVLSQAPD